MLQWNNANENIPCKSLNESSSVVFPTHTPPWFIKKKDDRVESSSSSPVESTMVMQAEENIREAEKENEVDGVKAAVSPKIKKQQIIHNAVKALASPQKAGPGPGKKFKASVSPKIKKQETIHNVQHPRHQSEQEKLPMEDDCSTDSGDLSDIHGTNLPSDEPELQWYKVYMCPDFDVERDEQIDLLLEMLECDKSEIPSIYRYDTVSKFDACMTAEEADRVSALGDVWFVQRLPTGKMHRPGKQRTESQKNIMAEPKSEKLSIGTKLSHQRQNKEKWRYDEDLELEAIKLKELEEEYSTDEDDLSFGPRGGKYWYQPFDGSGKRVTRLGPHGRKHWYEPFDGSGKRWYNIFLIDKKERDDQVALLQNVLKCNDSEIDDIYVYWNAVKFGAKMTDEDADKVAGLKEVLFVEPRILGEFIVLE